MKSSLRSEDRKNLCIVLVSSLLLAMSYLFAPIPSGRAADGRDFVADYSFSEGAMEGNGIRTSLSLELQNCGEADITGATIRLEEFGSGGNLLGAFPTIEALAAMERVKLSQTIVVPAEELDRWRNGGTPNVWIEFADGQGGKTRRPVEVSYLPGVEQP